MTPFGWLFLVCSLTFVWGLCGWCYYEMLREPDAPVEEVSHFHSA